MRDIQTRVLLVAALATFGFVDTEATARGGEPDPAQRQAIDALEQAGGFVSPGGWLIPPGVVVSIEGKKATDQDLGNLSVLKSVRVLVLDGTDIGDAGLTHLSELDNLKVLSLEYTKVSDAGLAHLKDLKKLRALDLKGTKITDAGLDSLKELKHLRELSVAETNISVQGIKKLRRSLWWCRIR